MSNSMNRGSGATSRQAMASPLSVTITPSQLQWIDQRRALGSLSRSAIVRQALDRVIELEAAQAAQPQHKAS
jgi:Arc/MetJ-type ribon-helix-helix transcriptional regulator